MKHKAPGPDGFQTEFILLLPPEAIQQLVELFATFESSKTWPSTLLHWKLAFLPKPHKDVIPHAGQMRPIAVGHVLYRIWSRIRLLQTQQLFTPFLAPFQSKAVLRALAARTCSLVGIKNFPLKILGFVLPLIILNVLIP